jgi:hypothetical protein
LTGEGFNIEIPPKVKKYLLHEQEDSTDLPTTTVIAALMH